MLPKIITMNIFLAVSIFCLFTCNSNLDTHTTEVSAPALIPLAYDLDAPELSLKLAPELMEISGLSMDKSGDFFWGVQDEEGNIYKINKKTGAIAARIKFHKAGDYEGIERVGEEIYVVKSTGTVYQVSNPGKVGQSLKKYNYFLSRENDVEGLAYDKKGNRLLLACKGVPASGESFEEIRYKKVIYAFDLQSNTIDETPVFTIHLDNIRQYLDQHPNLRRYEKLQEFFSAGKENLTFNPSAITVHPTTGEIYVLSSVGKVLIVLSPTGKIIGVEKMDKKIHRQPEGLTFDAAGTLYIANEGKGGTAMIHQFSMK